MREFKKLIKEINKTLNELILFHTIVNTILIFLSIYLFLALFNLYPIFAILPAVVYFFMATYKKTNINKMKIIEGKYDILKEKLRTAADNANLDNSVVNELKEEVMDDVKNVGISSFLNPKKISYRIFICVILAFTIVFVSTLHLSFLDLDNLIKQIPELLENNPLKRLGTTANFEDVNLTDDIYGDKELAVLGNEKINIRIQPANFKVSVKESGKIEENNFDEIFPGDVFVEGGEIYDEVSGSTLEEKDLIKTYFNKVTGKE
ncbi:hypothetical protein ISS05_00030 [Candidatus Woesearchaeota archaeon]|nr:hypothetical protein [Candidatus Woesearchaeota archaeon]